MAAKHLILNLLAFILGFVNFMCAEGDNTWSHIADLPQGNGGFVSAVDGQFIYLVGGTNWVDGEKVWLRSFWKFDLESDEWIQVGELPNGLGYGVGALYRDDFIIFGGQHGDVFNQNVLTLQTDSWEIDTHTSGQTTIYAGQAVEDGKLYFVGGRELSESEKEPKDSARFRFLCLCCRTISDLPDYSIGPVILPTVVYTEGGLYVFGGARFLPETGGYENVSSSAYFDFEKGEWLPLPDFPYPGRGMMAVPLGEGKILVGGGYDSSIEGFSAKAYIFDTLTGLYVATIDFPIPAMATIVAAEDTLYFIGGEDRGRHRSAKVFRAKISTYLGKPE